MSYQNKKSFGLIADGNRRWAREQNLPVPDGHQQGFLAIKDQVLPVLQASQNWGTLVVYGFSTENWKRSPLEVRNLMKLYESIFETWAPELIEKKIRLTHAGRRDRLPKSLLAKFDGLIEATSEHQDFRLVLCLDYGAQDELSRAVEQGGKNFADYLEAPDLDLILRTGGEQRLSNFCLYQAAYSEFCFVREKLPDLTQDMMKQILEDFEDRDRRRGGS